MRFHPMLRFFGIEKPGSFQCALKTIGRAASAVALTFVLAAAAIGQNAGTTDVFPVPGDPPLTRRMVDKGAKLFEWLLDARLTQEQYEQFQDSLIRSWKSNNREEIAGSVGVIQLYDALGQKTEAEREAFRETLRNKYLEAMHQTPNDVGSQWALGIYYSAHTPIADGNPPLTRQVADAYAEVMCFMISEVLGGEAFKPDKSYKDLLASSLATQYSGLTASRQKEFSEMPMAWASIRLNWPKLSAAERAKYRQEWTPGVRALLPPPAAGNNVKPTGSRSAAVTSAPPRSGSSAREVMRDFASRERTRQMLYNMNQDYLHKYVLSPGWTYMKYSTW